MIKLNELKKGTILKVTKEIEGISYKNGDKVSVYCIEGSKILLQFGSVLGVFSMTEINEYFELNSVMKEPVLALKVNKSEFIYTYDGSDISDTTYNITKSINSNPFSENIYYFSRKGKETECKIYDTNTKQLLGVGKAILNKGEEFNIEIGINVAKLKAEIDMNNRKLESINIKIDNEIKRKDSSN